MHLLTALDLSGVHTDVDYGQMTAVIRYKTPYTINGKGSFVLCFALGNEDSLRCVLRLPTLLEMRTTIGFVSGSLSCKEPNRELTLDFQPPGKCLSEGTTLNYYTHIIPLTASTNLLHHTSAEGTSNPIC